MPRTCTICTHPEKDAINAALIAGEPYRSIAQRFAAKPDAVYRHKVDHLPATLAKAEQAKEVAFADDLLLQLKQLRNKAINLLVKAETAGDLRTALLGIREARSCIELLAEMEGEIDRTPQINIGMAPEWLTLRGIILEVLIPYPDARYALSQALMEWQDGDG